MGVLVFILGRTGTGKSYSLFNFPKDKYAVINVAGKILPFRNSGDVKSITTDDNEKIIDCLEDLSKNYKSIVVDDFQYVMANEYMRRAMERGYDKFTEIGAHAWGIADKVRELPADVIVYIMCHTDIDAEGTERLKTIGKLLDEKIFLEGMSTIVLKSVVSDGKYSFVTQNNGKDTVKSPADMFPGYAINNDLYYVDQKIREYYELGETLTKGELEDADKAVVVEAEKPVEEKKRRRGRPKKEEEVKEEADTENKPKRRRRSASKEVEEVEEKNAENIANAGVDDTGEDKDFDEVEMPDIEEMPRRKRRRKTDDAEEMTDTLKEELEQEEIPEERKPRRRRRRSS